MSDVLRELQSWYGEQCNGIWEHQYGVSISNIDNPGWIFEVDLSDTILLEKKFESVVMNNNESGEWYNCQKYANKFIANCSPYELIVVIKIFTDWVNT